MSQETSTTLADQPLRTLIEQNATLIEILKHQNDRIARLEAEEPDLGTGKAIADEPEESHKIEEDAAGVDSEPYKKRWHEPAHFALDDCAMVMSVWPDPSQAVLTNTASESKQEWCVLLTLPIIMCSNCVVAFNLYHTLYGTIAITVCIDSQRRNTGLLS